MIFSGAFSAEPACLTTSRQRFDNISREHSDMTQSSICWEAAALASDAQSLAFRARARVLETAPSFLFRAVAVIHTAWTLHKLSAVLKKLERALASHPCLSCARVLGCEEMLRVIEVGSRGLNSIDEFLTQVNNNELVRGPLVGVRISEISSLAGRVADRLDDLRLIQSGELTERPRDEGFESLEEYLAKRR